MSKKNKIVLACVMGIMFVLSVVLYFFPRHNYSTNTTVMVEIEDGVALRGKLQPTITVNKSGEYVMIMDWMDNEEPSFITGIFVTDGNGNEIFSGTGSLARIETLPKKLSKGKYRFNIEFLASPEAFDAFAKQHGLDDEETVNPVASDFYKDGTAFMKYTVSVRESGQQFTLAMLIGAMIVGILLTVIILNVSRKGEACSQVYDERQIVNRGKAYKYAFITMLIYMVLLEVCYAAADFVGSFKMPVDNMTLILVGILISVLVYAIYAILKDAYFRPDDNRSFLFGFYIVLTVMDIVIGIYHVINGDAVKDGMITFFGCGGLLAGIAMAILIAVVIIKRVQDKRSEADEQD